MRGEGRGGARVERGEKQGGNTGVEQGGGKNRSEVDPTVVWNSLK